jgi:RES domain-containing protein
VNITVYRIAKARYGATIWSGDGAREFGGRWSSRGIAVAYAAQSRSLAALEQLVHLIKPRVLRGYVISSITFQSSHVLRIHPADLPAGWNRPVAPASLKRFGDSWAASAKYPVLAVPSAIIPEEWNYLVNPAHALFGRMARSPTEPFVYDARLR